jgi:hypothetical protein
VLSCTCISTRFEEKKNQVQDLTQFEKKIQSALRVCFFFQGA